jgi:ABC-2 type transport system ATP-binding protein
VVDGNIVGTITRGQLLDIRVEPGPHTIHVQSMRLLRSPSVSFDASAVQVVGLECHARSEGVLFQGRLFWLLASLCKHDIWIFLDPDESVEPFENSETATRVDSLRPSSFLPAAARINTPPRDGPEGEPALVVDRLTKRFGARTAFSDVSFEVAHGEVFGFLGPNGAGKTTTVRTLGTLIVPTSGSACVAGIPLTPENEGEIRQRISIMPEAPGLYLRLSVTENLEYFAALYGLHPAGTRIKDALDAVNLADRADDLCGGLSKGLRQRVGLARTLMSDPAIMFLDEPTSGLDPVAAREVHDLIIGLRQKGVTIFLTTHRLDEAEKLCDRVAILNTTLRTVGRPAELRAQLFQGALLLKTVKPLSDAKQLFSQIADVESWRSDEPGSYVLSVSDPNATAPEVVRALVGAGADVLSVGEAQHSLEDIYLQLVNEDVEVRSS